MVGRFFFFNGQSVLRLATAAPHLSRSIDDRLCLLPEYYYYNTWRKINKIPHDPLPQPNPFFGFGVSLFLFMSWENLFYFLVSLALSFSSHVSTMSRSKIGKWKKFHHHHAQYCPFSIIPVRGDEPNLVTIWWKFRFMWWIFIPQNESIC